MSDDFRKQAKQDFARLLEHWRVLEFWLKKAEQINKKASIPAINELRYASRQLFNAIKVFDRNTLKDGERSSIKKRIIIADQYMLNAEHDIADSIVVFFGKLIRDLDKEFG